MSSPTGPFDPAQNSSLAGSSLAGSSLAADPFAPEAGGSSFHIADYIAILKRRWLLIAVLTALSVAAFFARYLITPREYRAETQVQIERRSLSTLTSTQAGSSAWFENWWNMEYYPTQYRLLQSRGLAEDVVRNLRLWEDTDCGFGGPAPSAGTSTKTIADDEAAIGGFAGMLLGGLEVIPVSNTQLVVLGYRSQNPRCAAKVANGFADAFIEWGIERRAETVGQASTFLTEQIEAMKREIRDKETELNRLSQTSDLISPDPRSNVAADRLGGLQSEYSAAQGERIQKGATYEQLRNTPDAALVDPRGNPALEAANAELLRAETERTEKAKTFRPDSPQMRDLEAKIEKLRQSKTQLEREEARRRREAAKADYEAAQRKESGLAAALENVRQRTFAQSSASNAYNQLRRELDAKRETLDDLMRKQQEAQMTSRLGDARESNVRVVDRALVPGAPFRPSLRRELSLGMMLGLVAGLGIVFLLEFLDRTIKTPDELERLLQLPLLAVVPDAATPTYGYGYGRYGYGTAYGSPPADNAKRGESKKGDKSSAIELIPHTDPRSAIAEAYRSLRTALLLSSARELRVVSVASAESGEGKTSTATNLAVVMSQLDRRVLLIDGDLRKPRLHEIFKVSNRVGLVNILTGSGKTEEVFVKTPLPNLWLIPSGPTPPNPAELLASDRMREFIKYLREHFDFVVIDSPPTLPVTDGSLIGALADGVVLCLSAGKVTREDARACRDRLLRTDVHLLGMVLNRFRAHEGRYGRRYKAYAPYGGGPEAARRETPREAASDTEDVSPSPSKAQRGAA